MRSLLLPIVTSTEEASESSDQRCRVEGKIRRMHEREEDGLFTVPAPRDASQTSLGLECRKRGIAHGDDDEFWCQHAIMRSVNICKRPMKPMHCCFAITQAELRGFRRVLNSTHNIPDLFVSLSVLRVLALIRLFPLPCRPRRRSTRGLRRRRKPPLRRRPGWHHSPLFPPPSRLTLYHFSD